MLICPTLLVQQNSGERRENTRTSNFRLQNKHLEIGAGGDPDPGFRGADCLDFNHQEVRDERCALIEETLTHHEVDGFELQLNYWPFYFHPDEVEAGRDIMTEWVRRVHAAVKKSGSDQELDIRIPTSVEGCMSIGLDVAK